MAASNRISWIAAAAPLLLVMSGLAPAASPDEAAIRAQTTAWEKAYNGGDAKGVAALYAEDAVMMPPGAPPSAAAAPPAPPAAGAAPKK